jgi:hypothetical protein
MNELMQQTGAILTQARALRNLTGFGNLSGLRQGTKRRRMI